MWRFLSVITLFLVINTYARDMVYIRVTVTDTQPADVSFYTALSVYAEAHNVIDKFAFGGDQKIYKFPTGFHAVIDWTKLKNVPLLEVNRPSNWIDISDIIYKKRPFRRGWFQYENKYSPKTLVFSFYSPQIKSVKKGKLLEGGNFQSVTATIDFATAKDKKAIVKSISYDSGNSCIPIYILQPQNYLSAYADDILTLHSYAKKRLAAVKNRNVKAHKLPDRIITSTRVQNGYFYPLYDKKTMQIEADLLKLLGIRSCMWKTSPPTEGKQKDFKELDITFCEMDTPKDIPVSPWSKDFKAKVKQVYETKLRKIREAWKLTAADRILLKFGDEWRIIKTEKILKDEGGLQAFHKWLHGKKIKPQDLGVTSLDQVKPVLTKNGGDPKCAYLYYLTTCFRQEATVQWWKDFIDAIKEIPGYNLTCTTETFFGNYDRTPDFYKLSQYGVMDVDAHEYAQRLWEPSHVAIYKANLLRSAAKFGKTKPGILWCSHRGLSRSSNSGYAGILELDGTTALSNKMEHIYFYGYGPAYSGWGNIDHRHMTDVLPLVTKIFHRASKLEDYLLDGNAWNDDPEAAIVISRCAELWQCNKQNKDLGLQCERRTLAAALTWNQIPYDIIPEDRLVEKINNYKVLYLTDSHLTSAAQSALVKWVENGGILFMTAKAGDKNEKNSQDSLIMKLAPKNSTIKISNENTSPYTETMGLGKLTRHGTIDWLAAENPFKFKGIATVEKMVIPGGNPLARHDDGKAAAAIFRYGKGSVIRIGTALGAVLLRSMKPEIRQLVLEDHRQYDDNICRIYLYPYEINPLLKRPVKVNKPGIDAAFFEKKDGTGAVVLIADYASEKKRMIDISLKLVKNYTSCITESGKKLPLKKDDGRVLITQIPVETSQVLFLK